MTTEPTPLALLLAERKVEANEAWNAIEGAPSEEEHNRRLAAARATDQEVRRLEAERVIEEARLKVAADFGDRVWRQFLDARITDLADPLRKQITGWLEDDDRLNLVLVGPVGCGKTHAAIAAAWWLAEAGVEVWPISLPMLMHKLRPDGDRWAFEDACSKPILLLDDVGSEKATEWTAEQVAIIIDERWRNLRPIIATTNLTVGPTGELRQAIGDRSYSRLVGSGSKVLQCQGDDRRRAKR